MKSNIDLLQEALNKLEQANRILIEVEKRLEKTNVVMFPGMKTVDKSAELTESELAMRQAAAESGGGLEVEWEPEVWGWEHYCPVTDNYVVTNVFEPCHRCGQGPED